MAKSPITDNLKVVSMQLTIVDEWIYISHTLRPLGSATKKKKLWQFVRSTSKFSVIEVFVMQSSLSSWNKIGVENLNHRILDVTGTYISSFPSFKMASVFILLEKKFILLCYPMENYSFYSLWRCYSRVRKNMFNFHLDIFPFNYNLLINTPTRTMALVLIFFSFFSDGT